MTGFSITILFGGLVSTLRELMSPYKLNKIFIGGLVTGWRGLMSTYTEILCRGGPVTRSPPIEARDETGRHVGFRQVSI